MADRKREVEARLIRAVMERLLRDDFSAADCWIASQAFENEGFNHRLSTAIRAIAEEGSAAPTPATRKKSNKQKTLGDGGPSRPDSSELFNLYKRRKITKNELANILGSNSQYYFSDKIDELTARELIEQFIRDATPEDIRVVTSMLSPGSGVDPYLKGILRR